MKRRILAGLLSLVMVMSLLPGAALAAEEPVEPTEEQGIPLTDLTPAESVEDEAATAEEQLAELIAALPDPADIDPEDEEQVEAVNGQIAEIYAFAEENGLDVENDETINAVIAALYPVELLENSITADGGELVSGKYRLNKDITLTENLAIPDNANVTIDLNGHTLTGSGNGSVITVYGELTLNDSTATEQTNLSHAEEGTEKNGDGSWTVTYAVYDENNELSYRTYTAGALTGGKNGNNQGGGITVLGGTVVMNGGIITGNETGNNQQYALGGGIHLNKNEQTDATATFTMTDGAVSGNTANSTVTNGQGSGGGIYVAPNCKFEMTGGVFCFNQALGAKANGGVAFVQGEFSAANAVFSGNTSAHWTGGIMGTCTLTNCILVNNKTGDVAGSYGGAVSGGGKIDSCVISHNTATGDGGGLYLTVATTIENSVIKNNTSGANGGGISISSSSAGKEKTISISQSFITKNEISSEAEGNIGGGGIYVGANNTLKLTGAEVSENTVNGKNVLGGGIYNAGELLEITGNTEIMNNAANGTTTSKGGGIFSGNSITIESGEISGNRATQGGGVYIGNKFSMSGGKIVHNTATECGGGIYASAANPEFSGSAIVKDNTSGDNASVVDNLTFISTNSIYRAKLSGQLTDGAEIGIRVTDTWIDHSDAILVDAADNYTITSNDLSHIVYDGEQYVPYLDTDSNTVKVASAAIITFNSNTGTTSETTEQKVRKGEETALAANTFVRDGYIFSGWNTAQDGTGTPYADGAAITATTDTTLYAQWINLTDKTITMTYGDVKPLSEITVAGLTLDNWASDNEAVVKIDKANDKMIATGAGETTITADASLTKSGEKLTVKVIVSPKAIDGATATGTGTYTYTGEEITPTVTVELGGKTLTENDYTVTATDNTNAGTASFTVTGTSNYTGTVTGTFTIAPAPLTVTADDKTMVLGGALPTWTYTVEGLKGNDPLTTLPKLSCAADGKTAGKFDITISGAAAGENYTVTHVNGKLTVTEKADVSGQMTVTAPASLVYDGTAKAYTAACAGISQWTYTYKDAQGKTLEAAPVNAGAYTVTISGTGDTSFAQKTVNFTIEKAPPDHPGGGPDHPRGQGSAGVHLHRRRTGEGGKTG